MKCPQCGTPWDGELPNCSRCGVWAGLHGERMKAPLSRNSFVAAPVPRSGPRTEVYFTKCPQCNAARPENGNHCESCGKFLGFPPSKARCKQCGEVLPVTGQYCIVCGEKVPSYTGKTTILPDL